jgi:aldehyde dehydrogenase (NAD+)
MIIHESIYDKAIQLAKDKTEALAVGDPSDPNVFVGPMSSADQKQTVLNYINKGIKEGARLVTGGTEMPDGLSKGNYVRPTVFADVTNDMVIAQEEIFGPVLSMIKYATIDEAIRIANDTPYGLATAGGEANYEAPFGGYKESGNGREFGDAGLHEYCEIKSMQF